MFINTLPPDTSIYLPGLQVPHHRPKFLVNTMSHQIDPLARTRYILGWLAQTLRDVSTFYPPV
jgi:hypothetical protein